MTDDPFIRFNRVGACRTSAFQRLGEIKDQLATVLAIDEDTAMLQFADPVEFVRLLLGGQQYVPDVELEVPGDEASYGSVSRLRCVRERLLAIHGGDDLIARWAEAVLALHQADTEMDRMLQRIPNDHGVDEGGTLTGCGSRHLRL